MIFPNKGGKVASSPKRLMQRATMTCDQQSGEQMLVRAPGRELAVSALLSLTPAATATAAKKSGPRAWTRGT
jgi:hypothetical protein